MDLGYDAEALAKVYSFTAAPIAVVRASAGLINETWIVTLADGSKVVAQQIPARFVPEFSVPRMVADADAVTRHLEAAGIATPRLVLALDGARFARDANGRYFRVYSYVEGTTHVRLGNPAMAASAGALLGRVHRALSSLEHAFQWACIGLHDTAAYAKRLRVALDQGGSPALREFAAEILGALDELPPLGPLPLRVVHGDAKADNIRFDGDVAIALVDLDTVGLHPIAHELGDALRSWCDADGAFELAHFTAALDTYAHETTGLLAPDEIASIVPGVFVITLELAMRFCLDAFGNAHFAWDRSRYATPAEHNAARAREQLALARSALAQRAALEHATRRAFFRPG